MKKMFALTMAALLCAALLSACGGSGNSTATDNSASNSASANGQQSSQPGSSAGEMDFGEYSSDNPLVLKFAIAGEDVPTNIPNSFGHNLDAALEEASGGAISVDLYPGGILCSSELQTIEAVIGGTVNMGINNCSTYSNYVEDYSVFDLQYLFESDEHALKFMQSDDAEEFIGMMEEAGTNVTVLALVYMGPKNLGTTRPVEDVDDMQGLVVKVSDSEYMLKGFTAYGAQPQTMGASEIIPSLSQGIIEGQENTTPILDNGSEEYCRYLTNSAHILQFTTVNISTDIYRGLTQDMQALIKETAQQVADEMYQDALDLKEECEADLVSKGVTVYEIDQAEWIAKQESVYQEFFSAYGSEWYDRIKNYA